MTAGILIIGRLLRELWQITSTWDIDGWVGRICDASPETILEYRSYQEWNEHKKKVGFWCNLTEKEFISLQKLYSQGKQFFPVIYKLYETVLDVITLDWGDLEEKHTPSALSAIERAEQILTEHGTVPAGSASVKFYYEPSGWALWKALWMGFHYPLSYKLNTRIYRPNL